jgi:hypothetical protein
MALVRPELEGHAVFTMTDDDFLAALSAVDAEFAAHPSWQQVKLLAAAHPIFSRDDAGRSTAPMPGEGSAEEIRQSLSDFQEDFEAAVLTNAAFDLTSIEQVFASLSSGASAADPPG